MDPAVLDLPQPGRSPHPVLERPTEDGLASLVAQHQVAFHMAVLAQRSRQSDGQGNIAEASVLRRCDVTVPVRALYAQLAFRQVDVDPLQRQHFSQPQPGLAAKQGDQMGLRISGPCGLHQLLVDLAVVEHG